MGRTNRTEQVAAVVQPSPAVPFTSHDLPRTQPRSQRIEDCRAAAAAPTHRPDLVTGAQLAEKLQGFITITLKGIYHSNNVWVASRFAGDVAALTAAAERGDVNAQLAMMLSHNDDADKWVDRLLAKNDVDMHLFFGMNGVYAHLNGANGPRHKALEDKAIEHVGFSADRGSATAQHVMGMFMYHRQCDIGTKADLLKAARWIRKAAMQGVMEAQYELGEMFRHGLFCDHIYMRFAHKYIRRASVQGDVDAIVRMKELRSCVMCGSDDAPRACSRCHQARYCDSACSEKHWCEGGGVGGGVSGGAGARHKDMCPRTHSRSRHNAGRA